MRKGEGGSRLAGEEVKRGKVEEQRKEMGEEGEGNLGGWEMGRRGERGCLHGERGR